MSYRPNYDLDDSYHNWVEKLDLTCKPSSQIGLLGSMVFAGWVITLTFVPRVSDLYGRKKVFFASTVVQSIFYTVIMFTKTFWVALMTLFILGLCCAARAQVGILYILEFCPQ